MSANICIASQIYQNQTEFLKEEFSDKIPDTKFLWLTEDYKRKILELTGKKPNYFRVRYWKNKEKSIFILEDIGKTKPITVGFVIKNSKIKKVKILIYRESHGWEVKQSFFTNQFYEVALKNNKLTKTIDGIAGATLSVNALKRMTKIALYFNSLLK